MEAILAASSNSYKLEFWHIEVSFVLVTGIFVDSRRSCFVVPYSHVLRLRSSLRRPGVMLFRGHHHARRQPETFMSVLSILQKCAQQPSQNLIGS